MRDLMADDGSLYLHMAPNMAPFIELAVGEVFGRDRVLTSDGVRLFSQRTGRPSFLLIPLGGHRFAVESTPAMRMVFEATGQTVQAMRVEYAGEPAQPPVKRTVSR